MDAARARTTASSSTCTPIRSSACPKAAPCLPLRRTAPSPCSRSATTCSASKAIPSFPPRSSKRSCIDRRERIGAERVDAALAHLDETGRTKASSRAGSPGFSGGKPRRVIRRTHSPHPRFIYDRRIMIGRRAAYARCAAAFEWSEMNHKKSRRAIVRILIFLAAALAMSSAPAAAQVRRIRAAGGSERRASGERAFQRACRRVRRPASRRSVHGSVRWRSARSRDAADGPTRATGRTISSLRCRRGSAAGSCSRTTSRRTDRRLKVSANSRSSRRSGGAGLAPPRAQRADRRGAGVPARARRTAG